MTDEVTIVDKLYEDAQGLFAFLEKNEEISLAQSARDNFTKALLLAASSYFEHCVTQMLIEFIQEKLCENKQLIKFVENKAISRQYHTFFNWQENNANQFFGLFGETFKTFMKSEVKTDEKLNQAIRDFLEIGRERNRLVHQNFATFTVEKTTEEIYALYRSALYFITILPNKLRQNLE